MVDNVRGIESETHLERHVRDLSPLTGDEYVYENRRAFIHIDHYWSRKGSKTLKRPPDAGKVAYFEGMTIDQILSQVVEGKASSKKIIRRELRTELKDFYFWEKNKNNPNIVNEGFEAARIAAYFVPKEEKINYFRHYKEDHWYKEKDYRKFVNLDIRGADLYEYMRHYWNLHRSDFLESLMIGDVKHPFRKGAGIIPLGFVGSFRSLSAFDSISSIIIDELPQVINDRELNVLYVASGSHVAPLLMAMNLIDRGLIDNAEFVYTEISYYFYILVYILNQMSQISNGGKPLFEIVVYPQVDFKNGGGTEQVIALKYSGKMINIRFAYKRSGKKYYRSEHLNKADVVVFHDAIPGDVTGHPKSDN